jgi:predicted permease
MVLGRLRAGTTVDQARANISSLAGQLERAFPQTNDQMGIAVYALTQSPFSLKKSLQSALSILMAAVAVVLLIACANVANLLLGRADSRRKEIALRLALGGSRARLIRQMLTESLVLASLGAAIGLVIAFWAARSLPAFLPSFGQALSADPRPDPIVFAFTIGLTVVTAILCGLAPTLHASKPDLVTALKDRAGEFERGRRRISLRHALVVTQIALSMVALVSAGLLVRSLRESYQANPGFDSDRVLLASFDPFLSGYDASRGREFYRRLVERVRTLPGVQAATLARRLPLTLSGIAFANVAIDGYAPAPTEDMRFNYETIGPYYFQAMRIPLVRGRDIDERDHEDTQRVVIINETMAQRYWPGGDPIGGRVKIGKGEWLTIVGIAKDVKNRSLSEAPQPFFYLPLLQDYRSNMILVARTAVEPETMIKAVEGEVAGLDPGIPVLDAETMQEHIGLSLYRQRMAATLLSLFGALALALSAIGLYGVMTHSVSRRTRELGIRIAVGATHSDVRMLVLKQALILCTIGITVGLIAALGATRFLSHLLYGVGPADPLTFASVPFLLLGVALAAAYLPARRALKIDPLRALRID